MRPIFALLLATALSFAADGAAAGAAAPATSAPANFDKAIQTLEGKVKALPQGGIIAIGSSTFTRWGTMAQDLAPLPVFNAAFGGSRTKDVLAAVPRLVLPAKPKVVVYYCGDNDMGGATSDPQVPIANFKAFLVALRAELPDVKVVYVAIKPSPKREAAWEKVQEVNGAIKAVCAADPALTYVDFSSILLGADGKPDPTLYVEDHLHVTKETYVKFTAMLKPAVEKAWQSAGGK